MPVRRFGHTFATYKLVVPNKFQQAKAVMEWDERFAVPDLASPFQHRL
jgi:hypothetical protein